MSGTVADAIADAVVRAGVEVVFGVPGAHIDELCLSVARHPRLRLVVCRTEAGSGLMAVAHARTRPGTLGCCLTIPGPGLFDLGAALTTARAVGVPLLCIAGGVHSGRRGLGLLHESPDLFTTASGVVSDAHRLTASDDVHGVIGRLARAAGTPPATPALLEVPVDVSMAAHDPAVRASSAATTVDVLDASPVDRANAVLRHATRPLVVAGGGARNAASEVYSLAERLDAPVVPTVNGRCITTVANPRLMPTTALSALWDRSDAVVAVGTRLASVLVGGSRRTVPQALVRVDADPRRACAPPGTAGITGDALVVLPRLVPDGIAREKATWSAEGLAALRSRCAQALGAAAPHADYTAVFDEVLSGDAVIALDSTQISYHAMYALPLDPGRIPLSTGQQGVMGSALQLALGAKLAWPDRQVVCVIGDGGLVAGLGELATMVKERLGVVVVVFNDNAYSEVVLASRHQAAAAYSTLVNPDFVTLAAAYGITAARVRSARELAPVLADLCERNAPALVEVRIDRCPSLAGIFEIGTHHDALAEI